MCTFSLFLTAIASIYGSKFNSYNYAAQSLRCVLKQNETKEEFLRSVRWKLSAINVPSKNVLSMTIHNEMNNTKIQKIPNELFTEFPKLRALSFYSEIIDGISADDLMKSENLTNITVSKSKLLRHLQAGTFSPMKWINLDLSQNVIHEIDDFTFTNLSTLDHLYLNENNLTAINRTIFAGLHELQVLDLSENKIHSIEVGSFANLRKLLILDLNGNRLKVLRYSAFDGLGHLIILKIGNNQIESIETGSFVLHRLECLSLHNNSITDSELKELARLAQLQKLAWYRATLHLKNYNNTEFESPLRSLNLQSNNLTEVSSLEVLRVFSNLQELDLRNNAQLKALSIQDKQKIYDFFPKLELLFE